MPMNYFTMWGMLIVMAIGGIGELVAQGDLFGSVSAAYPSDTAEREALHRCAELDPHFFPLLRARPDGLLPRRSVRPGADRRPRPRRLSPAT